MVQALELSQRKMYLLGLVHLAEKTHDFGVPILRSYCAT